MTKNKITLYCSEESKERFSKRKINYEYIKRDLVVEKIDKGVIHPLTYRGGTYNWYGGVTKQDGTFIPLSAHLKGQSYSYYNSAPDSINYKNVKQVDKDVIFLGLSFNHYMHTLTETLSRMWYCCKLDKDSIKVAYIRWKTEHPVFFEIMEMLGIKKENIILIDKDPIMFNSVVVPEESSTPLYISKNYFDFLDTLKEKVKARKYKKIYFSRNKIKYNFIKGERKNFAFNMTLNEGQIEKAFKRNGYKIIYPESLNFKEKLSYLKNCDIFVALWGSNSMHSMFLKEESTNIILLRSEESHPSVLSNTQICIEVFHTLVPTSYSVGPFLLGGTEHLFNFFDDNNFIYKKSDFSVKASLISKYFLNWAENYRIHGSSSLKEDICINDFLKNIQKLNLDDDLKVFSRKKNSMSIKRMVIRVIKTTVKIFLKFRMFRILLKIIHKVFFNSSNNKYKKFFDKYIY